MRSSSKTFNEVLCCSLIRICFKPSFASLPSLGSNFFWASLTQGEPHRPQRAPQVTAAAHSRDVSAVLGSGAKWWETQIRSPELAQQCLAQGALLWVPGSCVLVRNGNQHSRGWCTWAELPAAAHLTHKLVNTGVSMFVQLPFGCLQSIC